MHISKKLLRIVGQTNAKYEMFEENDRILLGLSGGKDSLILSHILNHFQKVSPKNWKFKAVTVDYGIGQDFSYLIEHFKNHCIDYEIIKTNSFDICKKRLNKILRFVVFVQGLGEGIYILML